MRTVLLALVLAAATQAQLVTFTAGSPAKAADVNGNFAYLAARLDSLTKAQSSRFDSLANALAAKDTVIASLKGLVGLGDSLTKIAKQLDAGIPKGTIAGFLTKPGTDGCLPNSDQTWMLAAGQKGINEMDLPELRGVFLRGGEIDFNIAGGTMGYTQRDTLRTPGNFQDDAFQGHWHSYDRNIGPVLTGGSTYGEYWDGAPNTWGRTYVTRAITDGVNGTPRTAAETRPKNVVVYWYIKVK